MTLALAGCLGSRPPQPQAAGVEIATVEPAVRPPDLDSLAMSIGARADTLPVAGLPALEAEIRDWLGRLQFEDPALLPPGGDPARTFRLYRGRLLDALGWAAFRRGPQGYRQAEAALVSAAAEINSRGTAQGYARHFLHLGEVYAVRGRWDLAIEAYIDAETRGLGAAATPALEAAYRRRHGSLRGLDQLRARERARIEDERRQELVAGAESERLPAFSYPRRTGPPLASGTLRGEPHVVALWGPDCAACAGYAARLAALAAALRARDAALIGFWLGAEPRAAGEPQQYPILIPPDPAEARRLFRADPLPHLLVVDAAGWIRYRWSGGEATPPPIEDILVQVDHLRRRARSRAPRLRAHTSRPGSEAP
ncbi:MAG TPA: hypothetical protein VM737_07800 [Gemmatimonadota bacterium]|nr:hypothetical protein [Gemmatimonadota bacterium]